MKWPNNEFRPLNTACQNKGTNLKHQRHRFGLFSQGCLGWMVSPPWAQKFWARAHSPGIRALISCQNRQNGTPQNPLKGELLATTQLLVGQLGPQCLGNKPPSARHSPSRRNRARQMTIFDLNFWIVKSSSYLPEKNFSYIIYKNSNFFLQWCNFL